MALIPRAGSSGSFRRRVSWRRPTRDLAMHLATIAAGLMIAAAAHPAAARWEYPQWRQAAEQVIAASGGKARALPPARRYRDDAGGSAITVEGTAQGPPRLSIGFQFDLVNGGLRCVISNAAGDDTEALRS